MALAVRPPVVLSRKPERVVQVIKLHRKSYFGIHYPADSLLHPAHAVTEASVLGFSRRADAATVAGWLARHHQITKLWPSRLINPGDGLHVNAGELQPVAEEQLPKDLRGLSIEEEPFTLFLQALSLEGIALRLITDLQSDGSMSSTVFKERMDPQAVQQHLKALLQKKCSDDRV